jgi:hypothetical protein
MNIFALDKNPEIAAQYHNDKHVVKMILETAQLLSTAHHHFKTPYAEFLYKPTHTNHPSAIWVRENNENYKWAYDLLKALIKEYAYRYNKIHSTSDLLFFLEKTPENIPQGKLTPFALAMPDEFKEKNRVQSYRNYYLYGKSHLAVWTKRQRPFWYPVVPPCCDIFIADSQVWESKEEYVESQIAHELYIRTVVK